MTLLRTNSKKLLSTVPKKLVLTLYPDDELRVKLGTGRRPLTKEYGKFAE